VATALDAGTFSEDGRRADLGVREYRGGLDAEWWHITLTCVRGRWYPLDVVLTGVS
jgi:hypothetical protein